MNNYQFRKNDRFCNYNPASKESIEKAVKYCGGTKKDISKLIKEAKEKGFKVS